MKYDPSYEERISIREFDNGTVEFTKGMCLDLLIALQIGMNFRYLIVNFDYNVLQVMHENLKGFVEYF